ncbi:unnamed protein product [Moneuplotes crassus]|uniref:Uncharacterized protein n=1 Tax=Euplotes crassus TaxID=5936 RepID=A0AAD1Y4N6_EUPCR|nr:unnamed protein product [Moneuplotes crassus]
MADLSNEAAEDFLEKVNDLNKKVKGIIDGTIPIEQIDEEMELQEKVSIMKEKEAKEREEAKLRDGRKGKGHKGEYKRFCTFCFTEYDIEIENCTHCSHETITKEERMQYLKEKLEEVKEKKRTKMERRAKWKNWVKTQAMFYKKTSTNYKKWDCYESDSTDSEDKEPIVPEHDPNFKAMEADMMDRKKKRLRDTKEANKLKEQGNARLKKGLYRTAEKDYTDALELKKDLLPLYTNRALARNKLEKWTGAIDDCTRVLEYCEVFEDGFERSKSLCYKALIRRAVAFRGQRDYKTAQVDIEESLKLCPGEIDAEKLKTLNEEDMELEERIASIMEQRDGLSDKDFIDFTIDYLRGIKDEEIKIEEGKKENSFCVHPIEEADGKKLTELLLKSDDLLLYFVKNKGLICLKDSLLHNTVGIEVLDKILEKKEKVKEEFQKSKGYEALIDYLYSRSLNPEKKALESSVVKKVFGILEDATLNEFVRNQLSEKKKIKDLFISVLKALDVDENISLFGTLISFGSNLCFGKHMTRFRELLKKDFGDLMNQILEMLTYVIEKLKEDNQEKQEINQLQAKKMKKKERKALNEREKIFKKKIADRVLLKQTLCGFISNLALDGTFRNFFANEEFLGYMVDLLRIEKEQKNFDWVDSIERILGVLINCSLATEAQIFLSGAGVFELIEDISKITFYSEDHKTIITRLLYLLSRLVTQPEIILKIVSSKIMLVRLFLYFNKEFPDLISHVLKILFALFKLKDKLSDYTNQYEINVENFATQAHGFLKGTIDEWNREKFINYSGLISASLESFPESSTSYADLIPQLTQILKDHVDLERKNAAVLIAKMAKNEENKKLMVKHHTMEVLMSLGSNL